MHARTQVQAYSLPHYLQEQQQNNNVHWLAGRWINTAVIWMKLRDRPDVTDHTQYGFVYRGLDMQNSFLVTKFRIGVTIGVTYGVLVTGTRHRDQTLLG